MKLDSMDDPSDEMEPTVRGTILHDTMRRFFEKAAATLGTPVFLRDVHLPWAKEQIDLALTESMAALEATQWLGHLSLRDAKRAELARMLASFLEFEIESNEKTFGTRHKDKHRLRTAVIAHELRFGFGEDPFTIEAGGETLRVRGSIDRLEQSLEADAGGSRYLAAVDYKTTKYSTPGGGDKEAWDDDVVVQVPLYAIVARKLKPGSKIARVEYQAIKGCCRVHTLQLVQLDRSGVLAPDSEAQAKLDRAIEAIGEHVREARKGSFQAEPAESCGCPDFCVAIDICRVKGGPKNTMNF
jgi:hypothetical protein